MFNIGKEDALLGLVALMLLPFVVSAYLYAFILWKGAFILWKGKKREKEDG